MSEIAMIMSEMDKTISDTPAAESTRTNEFAAARSQSGRNRPVFRSKSGKRVLIAEAGSRVFKYIALVQGKNGYEIASYGVVGSEELSVESREQAVLFRAGVEWFKKTSTEDIDEVLVVSSNLDFFVRRLELPPLRERELQSAVTWEADKLIPIPVENSYLLIKKDKHQAGKLILTAGAVPHTQIDQWSYLEESLGGVIPTSVALANLGPEAESTTSSYGFVYSANDYLNIGFYNSSGLLYSHPIRFTPDRLFKNDEPELTAKRIADELINSIEVFYSYFPDISVKGLFLIVAPEQLQSVSDAILERIEINISHFDISSCPTVAADSSTGAALDIEFIPLLGAIKVAETDFKFLPRALREKRGRRKSKKIAAYGIAALASIAILLGTFWINDALKSDLELRRMENLKTELENSRAYRRIIDYRNATGVLASLKDAFESRDIEYSTLLKVLSSVTPAGVFLESVRASEKEGKLAITINAFYDGDISRTDIAIISLMEALNERGVNQLRFQRLGQKLSGQRKIESFQLDGKWGLNE